VRRVGKGIAGEEGGGGGGGGGGAAAMWAGLCGGERASYGVSEGWVGRGRGGLLWGSRRGGSYRGGVAAGARSDQGGNTWVARGGGGFLVLPGQCASLGGGG